MLNFPNAPTPGQIFTAPDGSSWTWDGEKWISTPAAGGGDFLPLTGGTLTGALTVASGNVTLTTGSILCDGSFAGVSGFNINARNNVNAVGGAFSGNVTANFVSLANDPTAPQHATTKRYVDAAISPPRSQARLQAQWASGAVVNSGDVVYFTIDAPYAGTINALTAFAGTGSFSAYVSIAGKDVGGLNPASVSGATPVTTPATSSNTFVAGQTIYVTCGAPSGNPTNSVLSLAVTWA